MVPPAEFKKIQDAVQKLFNQFNFRRFQQFLWDKANLAIFNAFLEIAERCLTRLGTPDAFERLQNYPSFLVEGDFWVKEEPWQGEVLLGKAIKAGASAEIALDHKSVLWKENNTCANTNQLLLGNRGKDFQGRSL